MGINEFKDLIDRYISGQVSAAEESALTELLKEDVARQQLKEIMDDQLNKRKPSEYHYPETVDRIRRALLATIAEEAESANGMDYNPALTAAIPDNEQYNPPLTAVLSAELPPKAGTIRRMHAIRRWGWVAAALVLLATGAWIWSNSPKLLQTAQVQNELLQHDLAPGKEGAVLTLADGSAITLDSLNNGMVANEHGTRIMLKNGQLAYDVSAATFTGYNTISTPNGRQFQVLLPDGTKVWLNAGSSLRYPTAFEGTERKVELTGEAYFEVTKNTRMPFRVAVNNAASIQVLGTRFNVNAYTDEPVLKTTLVDGSVKVMVDGAGHQAVVLEPGHQAEIKGTGIQTKPVDADLAIAWKNNEFRFNDDDLESVMRRIARWYDVKVVYEGADKSLRFGGVMSREENVSVVLKKLEQTGAVTFRIENKTIYVK